MWIFYGVLAEHCRNKAGSSGVMSRSSDIQFWSQFVLTTPPPPPLLLCRAAAGRDYSTPCRCRRGQEGENQCEPSPGLCLSIRQANTAQLVGLLPVKATIFIRICPSIAHYTFIMGFIDPWCGADNARHLDLTGQSARLRVTEKGCSSSGTRCQPPSPAYEKKPYSPIAALKKNHKIFNRLFWGVLDLLVQDSLSAWQAFDIRYPKSLHPLSTCLADLGGTYILHGSNHGYLTMSSLAPYHL